MAKLLILLLAAVLVWRLSAGRWPWQGKPLPGHASAPPNVVEARRLLGVPPGAGKARIIAAHRQLVARIHPDRGGDRTETQAANAARDVLLSQLDTHP